MKSSAISISRRLFSVAAIALAAGFSVSAHAEQVLRVTTIPEEAERPSRVPRDLSPEGEFGMCSEARRGMVEERS